METMTAKETLYVVRGLSEMIATFNAQLEELEIDIRIAGDNAPKDLIECRDKLQEEIDTLDTRLIIYMKVLEDALNRED